MRVGPSVPGYDGILQAGRMEQNKEVQSMTGILRCFQTNKTGRKNPWPIIFAFGCTALSLILLLVGISNAHRMGKSEQMTVAMLECLVIEIGETNAANLVSLP